MNKNRHITVSQLDAILAKDKRFESETEAMESCDDYTTHSINSHSGWVCTEEGCHVAFVDFYNDTGKSVQTLEHITGLLNSFGWWAEDPELTN